MRISETNEIISALPQRERNALLPHLETVSLRESTVLNLAGERIDHVYFPTASLISSMIQMQCGTIVPIAITGREGMLGVDLVLGAKKATSTATVAISGDCLRITVEAFGDQFERHPALRVFLFRYVSYIRAQLERTSACNLMHSPETRVCRWLLLISDRLCPQNPPFSAAAVGLLAGIAEPELAPVLQRLESEGIISPENSESIRIGDRDALRTAACGCYDRRAEPFVLPRAQW